LRLSLRRFSHGATASSSKASKLDTATSDANSSTLDPEIYPWSRCHQAVLRLAQGQKIDAEERAKISVSIRNLVCSSKNLANVLLDELFAASALQAALRQLASSFDKCTSVNAIAALWSQFYTVILPDLHALLYAFEESHLNDIRKMTLIAFRDGVIMDPDLCSGVLSNSLTHPVILRMLLILEQNTRDGSINYAKVQALCERLLGDFSSSETTPFQPITAASPIFFLEEQEMPRQRSASPKALQRLLRRAKGSFSALTGDHSDLSISPRFLEVKTGQDGRSRSPLARVRTLLDGASLPRRHSYAPGSS